LIQLMRLGIILARRRNRQGRNRSLEGSGP